MCTDITEQEREAQLTATTTITMGLKTLTLVCFF